MNYLVLCAFAALFGSTHCNFQPHSERSLLRAAVEECWIKPIPSDESSNRLCDGVRDQVLCLADKLKHPRSYNKWLQVLELRGGMNTVCDKYLKTRFDVDKKCFQDAIVDNVCVESINEANKNIETSEDLIRANKKTCSLFEPYSKCVIEKVVKNCKKTVISYDLFKDLFNPLCTFTKSLCQELIIPADEQDSQPDNFGMINVYQSVIAIFDSA